MYLNKLTQLYNNIDFKKLFTLDFCVLNDV